jgi:NAD(P)-dependent dehydrogenase (short-subunit alcohol dehydrogenase family)
MIALSKSLARENGRHNIRFNVVCPGTTLPAPGEEIGPTSLWATDEMKVWLKDDMRSRIGKAYPLRRVGSRPTSRPPFCFSLRTWHHSSPARR